MKSRHGALWGASDGPIVPAHEWAWGLPCGVCRQCLARCFVALQQGRARKCRYSWGGRFLGFFFVGAPSPVCRPVTLPLLMVFTDNPFRQRHWLLGFAVAVAGLLTTLWLAQQQARSVAAISEARFLHEAQAFNRLLKYCCRTHKMTTLRVPHPLPGSK